MSHSVYSTFRSPQGNKFRRPAIPMHDDSGVMSDSPYGYHSVGRRSEGVKGVFTPPVTAYPTSYPVNYYGRGPLTQAGTVAARRPPQISNGPQSLESKLGSGFNTLPGRLHRGVRVYDPLNNVNRFSSRRPDPVETAPLNNFDYYRTQQQTSFQPPPGPSRQCPSPQSFLDYDGDDDEDRMSYLHSKGAAPEHHMARGKPAPENKSSLLLSSEENRSIFDILGRGRQTLSTAVGRLLVPTPDQTQWQVKDSTGAICLVRDTTKKSYFIQVFSLRAKNMIFRQEIYNQFEYDMSQPTFMTFEGDNSMVAILFADPTEASNFREALDSKLEAKRQRRSERDARKSRVLETQVNNVNNVHHNVPTPHTHANNYNASNNVHVTPPSSYPNGHSNTTTTTTTYNFSSNALNKFTSKKPAKGKEKDKKKAKLTAKDIGTPMDFRHVQHVGWDPTKGFDLNLEDKDLRTFFEKAGVSANQLNDENTRKFIYNFIEEHGGVDVVKRSASSTAPARAPPPVPPAAFGGAGPPPVPTRTPSIPNSNYPGSTKAPPPPPPPSRPVPPPPPAATYPGGSAAAPPPPPMRTTSSAIQNPATPYHQPNVSNGPGRPPMPKPISANGPNSIAPPPPPPPPPMPMGGGAPPPPPPPPPATGGGPASSNGLPESHGARGGAALPPVSDDRSQLMKQIQRGIQLKKVEVDSQPKRTGGISDCLSEIQKGIDLKPVPESAKAQPSLDSMDGLAGALARALADRQRAVNPNSSSEDDDDGDEYDEEEWE